MNVNDGLLSYLGEQIPLSKALGLQVLEAGSRVVLQAPLEPNLNHKHTAFGGSIYVLAVLTGWSWVWLQCRDENVKGEIVIAHSEINYNAAISAEFTAHCEDPGGEAWNKFMNSYKRKGKGRLDLNVVVRCKGKDCAQFLGTYVILGKV